MDSIYSDLDYRLNSYNNDIKISTDVDAINNSIRNILLTQKYSVPGNPEFGSELNTVLFEQMDDITFTLAENIIRTALNDWEPRIEITDVDTRYEYSYQQLIIKISYIIITSNEIETLQIKVG